jgi:hypothetical protein
MSQHETNGQTRQTSAREAWSRLAHGGRDAVRLRIQCERNHHMATVYDTPDGLVVATTLRARSHGSRDRVDVPHGEQTLSQWIDFLEVGDAPTDDAIPAWCDCGTRTLSRADLLAWISAGEARTVVH